MSEKSPIEQAVDDMIEAHQKALAALMIMQGCKTIEELADKAKEAKEGKKP
jgi:isopentenyl diphosphate isomerase/L-lactate dehydrogenase-like FMN-dependent dehydrogenase